MMICFCVFSLEMFSTNSLGSWVLEHPVFVDNISWLLVLEPAFVVKFSLTFYRTSGVFLFLCCIQANWKTLSIVEKFFCTFISAGFIIFLNKSATMTIHLMVYAITGDYSVMQTPFNGIYVTLFLMLGYYAFHYIHSSWEALSSVEILLWIAGVVCFVMGLWYFADLISIGPYTAAGQRSITSSRQVPNHLCGDGTPVLFTSTYVCPNEASSERFDSDVTVHLDDIYELPGSCEHRFTHETCAACPGGCGGDASSRFDEDRFWKEYSTETETRMKLLDQQGTPATPPSPPLPPSPSNCCQAKPEYSGEHIILAQEYKQQCITIQNRPSCTNKIVYQFTTRPYERWKICQWTCGECDDASDALNEDGSDTDCLWGWIP